MSITDTVPSLKLVTYAFWASVAAGATSQASTAAVIIAAARRMAAAPKAAATADVTPPDLVRSTMLTPPDRGSACPAADVERGH